MFELIKGEKVIIAKRRHYVALVLQALPIVLFIVLLVLFAFFNFFIDFAPLQLQESIYNILGRQLGDIETHFLASFLATIVATFLWFIVLFEFIFFYLDSWIITNKRIIKIKITGLFHRKLYTTALKNIENIRTSRVGVLANIYKFGNLEVETAGNYENFILKDIAQPEELKRVIFKAIEEDRATGRQR